MADKNEKQCTVIVSCEVAIEDAGRFLDSWEDASGRLVPFPIHASAYEIVRT